MDDKSIVINSTAEILKKIAEILEIIAKIEESIHQSSTTNV